uniref:CCHC-type domain-containing protein n=1 Tax=Tanacetum cinerariifolium TaxID=118510 RepID=A0A6L2L796_TANCI|nr:hypothetical protein [Tanacetum cinerariifolium]
MSNTNNTMQTQTSNALHNAIMEAGGKDHPPMLAPDNYVLWKSKIKRYTDTKPNHELIHYCLQNPPYEYKWIDKAVLVAEGSTETTTERYMENYKNVSQDIRDKLNVEAEAIQIILTGMDNDIYSTVNACPNACEMWKAIERFHKMMNELVRNQCDVTNHQVNVQFLLQLQPKWQRGKAIVNSPLPIYDQEPTMVVEDDEMSKDNEIDKLMALISLSFKKIYKPTNNNLRTSTNNSRANQDNSPRINRGTGYDNQRIVNVARARENVGTPMVQQSGIQCYNYKEYGHVARECQKPKRAKDAAYHKEKMLLYDEPDDQELEEHYMYMAQIQEVTPDAADNYGPIFDSEPLQKDDDDISNERDLLASLIEKLKCEIDDNKNRNKFLETSNQALVDKLKGEIEDFKTKNKSLESSNNHFKEANNELSKTNQLMFKDLKKFQAELDRYHDVKYASKVKIDCAKAKGDLMSYKMVSKKSSNEYTRKIHELNQMISKMKKELFAHQETISIMSQEKAAQIKFYKTCEDKEIDKVISLENKVKVLDNIVYKTGCYNDNLALMLSHESDEVIRLEKESRSKLSDLIRPFDNEKLNNLYDLFIPQREKSSTQRYFSEREKMLLYKQEEARIQLNAEQADWRDDTDDELEDQELEAHYMYMAQIQEVSPDAADFGPIFDSEPVQKVSTDNHYNVFSIESEHPEQSESIHDTYSIEQYEHNVIIDSLDMSYDREQIDLNDDDNDLANERELLASLIAKLKCEIDDSKIRNKFLETSNKILVEKLKDEIEDFKNKNISLESSNNRFKEANNKLSETNKLLYNDFKKSQAELERRNDVEYASKVEIDCAKAKGDLISYKIESQKSFNKYTQTINDLNQMIFEMKKKLCAHQETISILSQHKEAQIKLYKTHKDKELDKVIALENKVKVLDNIVYKTGQSVQTMNMLNNKCRTSFAKPKFLKKAQRANPLLYDIDCYNDNLALMLAPESDEVIRLEKESRSKLSDLIRPFDYDKLNNLYDLFVPQREKLFEQRYFSETSRLSHTPVNNGNSKESFNKQSTLLEKRMDESIP